MGVKKDGEKRVLIIRKLPSPLTPLGRRTPGPGAPGWGLHLVLFPGPEFQLCVYKLPLRWHRLEMGAEALGQQDRGRHACPVVTSLEDLMLLPPGPTQQKGGEGGTEVTITGDVARRPQPSARQMFYTRALQLLG